MLYTKKELLNKKLKGYTLHNKGISKGGYKRWTMGNGLCLAKFYQIKEDKFLLIPKYKEGIILKYS